MFSRIFRRRDGFRRLWAELARAVGSPGDRRIAGIRIAYLGRWQFQEKWAPLFRPRLRKPEMRRRVPRLYEVAVVG